MEVLIHTDQMENMQMKEQKAEINQQQQQQQQKSFKVRVLT